MKFARRIQQALLALSTGLAMLAVPAAQADTIEIKALTEQLQLAPGTDATLQFKFDFGTAPLEFFAFDFVVAFNGSQIAINPADMTMSFSDGAPNLGGGETETNLTPLGYHYGWATLGIDPNPTVSGTGLLSVKLHNLALASQSQLVVGLVYSTPTQDDIEVLAGTILTPVPEPASWALALAGIGFFVVLRRRGAAQAV